MAQIHVTPADGQTVIDPVTKRPLPSDGATVEGSNYWNRRARRGEVTIRTASKSKPKTKRATTGKQRKVDAKIED
jgi:hypothetical protein